MKLNNIFNNKNVLVTGHTGFKGSWLSLWMTDLGAKVFGISIDVPSNPSHFNVSKVFDCVDDRRLDIRNAEVVNKTMQKIEKTGLTLQANLEQEIDNTLLFCKKHFYQEN